MLNEDHRRSSGAIPRLAIRMACGNPLACPVNGAWRPKPYIPSNTLNSPLLGEASLTSLDSMTGLT